MCEAVYTKISENGFEFSPYPPDLAPSDYYLFSTLKKHLEGSINGKSIVQLSILLTDGQKIVCSI